LVRQHDIFAGDIMQLPELRLFQPAKDGVVFTHHGRVRDRANAQVHLVVFEDQFVGLVIPLARQACNDIFELAIFLYDGNCACMDYINLSIMECDRGDEQLFSEYSPLGQHLFLPIGFDASDFWLSPAAIVAFGNQHPALVIERDHGGRG
jgi:hypothetical protein